MEKTLSAISNILSSVDNKKLFNFLFTAELKVFSVIFAVLSVEFRTVGPKQLKLG